MSSIYVNIGTTNTGDIPTEDAQFVGHFNKPFLKLAIYLRSLFWYGRYHLGSYETYVIENARNMIRNDDFMLQIIDETPEEERWPKSDGSEDAVEKIRQRMKN